MLGDPSESVGDRARHVDPRSLRGGSGLGITTATAERRRQLVRDEVDLGLKSVRARVIVEAVGLFELLAQLIEASAVFGFGLRVEDLSSVAEAGDDFVAGLSGPERFSLLRNGD